MILSSAPASATREIRGSEGIRGPDYFCCCGVPPLSFRRFFLTRASTKRSIMWPNSRRGFLGAGTGTGVEPRTVGGESFSKEKAGMTSPFNIELNTPRHFPCNQRIQIARDDNPAHFASLRLDRILCQNQAKLQHVAEFAVRL